MVWIDWTLWKMQEGITRNNILIILQLTPAHHQNFNLKLQLPEID